MERRPERRVAVPDAATGEVLGRPGGDGDGADLLLLPPVQLGDALRRNAPALEVRADA
jgi:hypothetical protein